MLTGAGQCLSIKAPEQSGKGLWFLNPEVELWLWHYASLPPLLSLLKGRIAYLLRIV